MKKFWLLCLILVLACTLVACDNNEEQVIGTEPEPEPEPTPIYNPLTHLQVAEEIEARIFLVSIGNGPGARPHRGVSAADIIYEVPAEGNIPRILALFYSSVPEEIGGVRSARKYIVDIAREWDAVMVHCGGSPEALSYLNSIALDDLDEIARGKYFWRQKGKDMPHDLLTSGEKLYEFLTDREKRTVNENVREFRFLEEGESISGQQVNWISVKYTDTHTYYSYDSCISSYVRSVNDEPYIDAANNETIRAANIIVQKVTSGLHGGAGRIAIDLCAGGEAWLFTEGKMVKGNWSRADLDSPTIFTDENGEEFQLSAGRTCIQIIDGNSRFTYDETHPLVEETPDITVEDTAGE